jgi:hypothetical protein
MRKSLSGLFALTAVFIISILIVLRMGGDLQAPAPLGDIWGVNFEKIKFHDSDCRKLEVFAEQTQLVFIQSGKFVDVQFPSSPPIKLSGILNHNQLEAQGIMPGEEVQLFLTAQVQFLAERSTMHGQIHSTRCSVNLTFTANHVADIATGEVAH